MRCRICGAALPDGAMFCGHCGSSTSATPESRRRPDPRPGDTMSLGRGFRHSGVVSIPVDAAGPVGEGSPAASATGVTTDAPATTPPVAVAETSSPRFVLRFGSGEIRVVFGTGLIGRRPLPQPGETFDHLVHVEDPSRSVSKTHLEFGVHDDSLWIADRFSGNGTVLRRLDEVALRCEPGRRYLVPRGAVVEMAEQRFTVG
ncbi:zinc-ribbon domain-containing protein [Agromyces sp. Marseille-Q5079]|uniref:zinc-ribbon domain-containing protein n=1 Tax=Agromyces sp. Marseille-Q5079 TaxID=3439059 RepID=UPI003D9C9544